MIILSGDVSNLFSEVCAHCVFIEGYGERDPEGRGTDSRTNSGLRILEARYVRAKYEPIE